jgi:segregation and condensation protein A
VTVVQDPVAPDGVAGSGRFTVRLENFEGPFDLLLQLISQHQMDVTDVALHRVTDEFITHLRLLGDSFDLDETTEFLVVAATLLDLKAARLLQYRAYKQVAALFAELEAGALRRYPRSVAVEDRFADLLPEVMLGVDAACFAEIAAAVFRPKPPPTISLEHLHSSRVSVHEHAALLRTWLARQGEASFRVLVADCAHTGEIVARFLALLDLYREGVVLFDQTDPLGELFVRWTGGAGYEHPAPGDPSADEDYG